MEFAETILTQVYIVGIDDSYYGSFVNQGRSFFMLQASISNWQTQIPFRNHLILRLFHLFRFALQIGAK